MSGIDFLFAPFTEFAFMRRALAGSVSLAFAAGPLGVVLVLRRMSLMGDAMAHVVMGDGAWRVGNRVAGGCIGRVCVASYAIA